MFGLTDSYRYALEHIMTLLPVTRSTKAFCNKYVTSPAVAPPHTQQLTAHLPQFGWELCGISLRFGVFSDRRFPHDGSVVSSAAEPATRLRLLQPASLCARLRCRGGCTWSIDGSVTCCPRLEQVRPDSIRLCVTYRPSVPHPYCPSASADWRCVTCSL